MPYLILALVAALVVLADFDRAKATRRVGEYVPAARRPSKLGEIAGNCWSAVKVALFICSPLLLIYLAR